MPSLAVFLAMTRHPSWTGEPQSLQAYRSSRDYFASGASPAGAVPVSFRVRQTRAWKFVALRNPRRDMVWVAAAGPATNIVLAVITALGFHLIHFCRRTGHVGWLKT